MSRSAPIQQSFNGGEFSPLLTARTDFEKYKNGAKIMLNNVPTIQGPYMRRPGFQYVAEVKDSSKAVRLIPFEFSTTQAYIIEVGDQYMRFYKDNGQIESGGSPYEIVTPYLEADIFDLQFAQSADVLFITHPDYEPRELSRTAHTSWTLTTTTFWDGPYLPLNLETTTLVASAATGSVTVTASAVTGINGGDGFQSTDVGRFMRIYDSSGTTWGWGEITAVTDTLNVTATVMDGSFPTVATDNWRLGAWSDTDGWPGTVTFYEDRLWYAGTTQYPQRMDGSRTGDYTNFSPNTLADATVLDDHALSLTLNANQVNKVNWLLDHEKGLMAGTTGGVWLIRANSLNEVLTPTNVKATRPVSKGSAAIAPIRTDQTMLFVQRAGRKLREVAYSLDIDGLKSPDMTILSEHISESGFKQMDYQQDPHSVIWAVRTDGVLAGFTYSRDEDVVGWHRHIVGGYSDSGKTVDALVESVAVAPSADGTYDELWIVVQRYINGGTVRYVEYMHPYWDNTKDQEDAFFVDCGLTYDGAAATAISGLDHLEGETVSILADGAVHPDLTVASGAITLSYAASKVHVGLSYNSDFESLSFESGAADGTAQGKTKRINEVTLRMLNTLGVKCGPDEDNLETIVFRKTSDPMGEAVPLFTGDKEVPWDGDYDTAQHVFIRQDQPVPGTILAIMPRMVTYDAA